MDHKHNKLLYFIRQPQVTKMTTIPKSSIPTYIEKQGFPDVAEISARGRVWELSEVQDWMQARLDERSKNKLKQHNTSEENADIK